MTIGPAPMIRMEAMSVRLGMRDPSPNRLGRRRPAIHVFHPDRMEAVDGRASPAMTVEWTFM